MKLYKITIKGGTSASGTDYNTAYVVASDPAAAYKKYRSFLDKEDLCFTDEREMKKIELIADQDRYGECGTLLFVAKPVAHKSDCKFEMTKGHGSPLPCSCHYTDGLGEIERLKKALQEILDWDNYSDTGFTVIAEQALKGQ
jgi:hypothetical protein